MTARPLALAAAFAVALAALAGWAAHVPLTLAPGATMTVEGSSNVHGWSCDVGRLSATGDGAVAAAGLASLAALTVTVPVAGIDCDNGTMNGKLREALRAPTAPNVRFVLTSATVAPAPGGRSTVTAAGQLTIAGQTRPVRVTAEGRPAGAGRVRVTGSVPLLMSQYGIRPPTAMMGTMRTRDAVTVRFDVTLAAR